jgi:hypothetical protein
LGIEQGCFGYGFSSDSEKESEPATAHTKGPVAKVDGVTVAVMTIEVPPPPKQPPSNTKKEKLIHDIKALHARVSADYPGAELGTIAGINGGGYFEVTRFSGATMSSVFCINPGAASSLAIGDTVLIKFYDNSHHKPYIRSTGSGSGQTILPAGIEQDHGGIIIPLDINSGLWIQSGGFWWQSYSSLTNQQELNITPTVVNHTETFTPGDPGNGYFSPNDGAGTVYFRLLDLPPKYTDFKFTDLKINGTSYFGAKPPGGYSSPDPVGYFLGAVNYSGYNNYYSNSYIVIPQIYLQNIPDTSTSPLGPTILPSAITSVEISYKYNTSNAIYLSTGTAMSGPDTALSCRGIVMFPNTVAPGDQMAADLNYTYVADGGESIPTDQADALTYTPETVSIGLSHLPIPGSIDLTLQPFSDFNNIAYTLYVEGQNLYALATSQSSGYYLNGPITITYGNGPATAQTETFTGGGDFFYTFVWDGQTRPNGFSNIITVHSGSSIVASFDNSSYPLDTTAGGIILSVANMPGGNQIEISFTGATIGDVIVVKYTASWDLSVSPFIVQTSFPIDSLISLTVDGVKDLLATFYGNGITLSSAPPSSSSVIVVDYTSVGTSTSTYTFPIVHGQTAFMLPNAPTNAASISVPTNSNPDQGFNFQGTTHTLVALIDPTNPKLVRFAIKHLANSVSAGFTDQIDYKWNRVVGTLFHITNGVITERDITQSGAVSLSLPFPAPFDATPRSQLKPKGPVSSAQGIRWQDGWDLARWGFLYYDPSVDGYTAVTPVGIFWRSRTPGDASSNYTFTPWPEESVSDDKQITGYTYPSGEYLLPPGSYYFPKVTYYGETIDPVATIGIKTKTAPFFGVSVAEKYALQGSWPAVGPNKYVTTQGAFGCSDYILNFWLRDTTTKKWDVQGNLSVRKLVEGSIPNVYIPPSGLTQLEGASGRNSGWPCSRQAKAWIIACGWCSSNWGERQDLLNTRENWHTYKKGHDDAGLTLNAVDMAGNVISQLTYKPPLEPTDGVSNFSAYVDYILAHNEDQFLKPEGQAYSGYNGSLWFIIDSQFSATPSFNYLKDYGYAWYYYVLSSLDGAPKSADLRYPGIPTINGIAKLAGEYGTMTEGYSISGGPETFQDSQEINMDSDDNIYFTLKVPFWLRDLDEVRLTETEIVNGVYTLELDPNARRPQYIEYDCTGYDGVPAITAIRDRYDISGYEGSLPAPDYPHASHTYTKSYPQTGFTSIFQTFFNKQVMFGGYDRYNVIYGTSSDGSQVYLGTDYFYDGPLVAPWNHIIPHRQYTTLRTTHDFGSGVQFYYRAGYGGQFSGTSPYRGAAIYDTVGDYRKVFQQSVRTYLKKVHFDGAALVEKWSLDISELDTAFYIQHWGNGGEGERSAIIPVPIDLPVYYTRTCGRYIFVLKGALIVENTSTSGRQQAVILVLDVYDNGDTAPSDKRYRFSFPGNQVIPTTVAAAIALPGIGNLHMIQGINSNDEEYVVIQGESNDSAYFGVKIQQKFQITFHADQSVAPTYLYYGDSADITPTPNNWQGMASAGNYYVYTDDNASVIKVSGGG